ncbi:MAG TPA: hypothetical protein PL077_04520 [Treponemataceae bacterium]|nr:hypothetical protein [Treponemataceae bacterium]
MSHDGFAFQTSGIVPFGFQAASERSRHVLCRALSGRTLRFESIAAMLLVMCLKAKSGTIADSAFHLT